MYIITPVKINDIGIRKDLLEDMSLSEEVIILDVSLRALKDIKVKRIARNLHLFILQYINRYTNRSNFSYRKELAINGSIEDVIKVSVTQGKPVTYQKPVYRNNEKKY